MQGLIFRKYLGLVLVIFLISGFVVLAGTVLNRASAQAVTGSISGTVTEEITGDPIGDCYVDVYETATGYWVGFSSTDTEDGTYTVEGLPDGTYRVEFTPNDNVHIGEWWNDQPDFDNATDVNITASGNILGIDAVLAVGGSISGTVTEEITGDPIGDCWVDVYDAATGNWMYYNFTDTENGTYTIGGLPDGTYRVEFTPDDGVHMGEWWNDQSDFDNATDVNITAPGNILGMDAALAVMNPVPTITTLSPAGKTAGGAGFTLAVNGTGFMNGSKVRWNGVDRTTVYKSPTLLTASIPASDIALAGTANITVFNPAPGGGVSNGKTFTVKAPNVAPVIDSISPACGCPGTIVTITGNNFGDSRGSGGDSGGAPSYVSFNGVPATAYSSWTNTEIVCTVPEGVSPGPVAVIVNGVSSNGDESFMVAYPTWYLAEGTTDWGFSTYISIENPNDKEVMANITYMTKSGAVSGGTVNLPEMSQTTVNPADTLGSKDFSTLVESRGGETIAVDRTMTWTGAGAMSPEAHTSVGVNAPAETWYLPEGSASWGFECWLLIQNPNDSEAVCQVTYMIENVGFRTVEKRVAANSRNSFNIADDMTDVAIKDASIKVESNVPVIPERAMYRNDRREGHDSIGTTTPATDYYLAEGCTGYNVGYITYVLVQNPNDSVNNVSITYLTGTGEVKGPDIVMEPNSRKTIRVNDQLDPDTDVSTHVHGEKPIIAERAMYWNGGTGEACHDSIGMASAHTTFYLPDGQTSDGRETWTLVSNPNDSDVEVEISYLTEGGTGNKTFIDTIKANSRQTYDMSKQSINGRAAVLVTCMTEGKKIMVERAMYWNSRGAGTDTIGGYSD